MSRKRAPETVPTRALVAAGCLVIFSLASVSVARLSGYMWSWKPDGTIVASRLVDFRNAADGNVEVKDAETGKLLGSYEFTKNAFMRTVMLGLNKERAIVATNQGEPFRIDQWNDGRVTISDPVSGRSFELAAFGHHQIETFSALLN